jgi:hypothetical protein
MIARTRASRLHLIVAGVLLAGCILLAVGVWVAVILNWRSQVRLPQPFAQYHLANQSLEPSTLEEPELIRNPPRTDSADVFVHLTSFSIGQRELSYALTVVIPPRVASRLVDNARGGQAVAPQDLGRGNYQNLEAKLILGQTSLPMTLQHIPLLGTALVQDYGTRAEPVSIGRTSSFPNDSYWISIGAAITLPPALGYRTGTGDVADGIPAAIVPSEDLNFGDYTVDYQSTSVSNFVPVVNLHVARPMTSRFFVIAMSALPLATALLLGHLAVRRAIQFESILLLLFTALFTIMPLRAVLVPYEAVGITVVDRILGSELMLLLVVGAAAYWRHIAHGERLEVDPR